MAGMPCAFALAATAAPDSLLIEAMTSTLTWLVIMLSASVENFCSSPWAFWMSAWSPAACIAAVSSGLSKPSQRAELAVSGRITPTLAPLVAAGAAEPPPLELGAAAFWPQAASERARPSPAAASAALVERIVVLPTSAGNVVADNVCRMALWRQAHLIVQVIAESSRFGEPGPEFVATSTDRVIIARSPIPDTRRKFTHPAVGTPNRRDFRRTLGNHAANYPR